MSAEFASRRGGGRSSRSRSLARSIDGRNSDRVADGADRYRRFSSSPRHAASLVRIVAGCGTDERRLERASRRAKVPAANGRRTMVWVRTAVLEIPRQSVELKAREANLSSLPSLSLLGGKE